jgi:hypothetical protein
MPANESLTRLERRESAAAGSVNLRYLGRLQIAVSGACTGNLYRFSPAQPVLVDREDASYLLASGLFGVAI